MFNDEKKHSYLQNKLLNSNISQFFGNISYSLYLIHLPVFVFYRYIFTNELDELSILICVIVSISISYLMWKFIEQPFRNKKRIKTKVFLSLSGLFIIIFLCVSFLIQNNFINSYRFVEMKMLTQIFLEIL